jgi:peptidoglycan hydrolase-like protein with peptidoglycan-binding domain
MARYRYIAPVIAVLISACVTAGPELQPTEIPLGSATSATQSDASNSAVPAKPVHDSQAAHRTPSKLEIRLIQTRMRETGFDGGPIDGVMGPKTKAALHRFQTACASLGDLLETSVVEDKQSTGGANSPKLAAAILGLDDIRHVQTRVKAAGFNAGPIDGVMGAKTKSALIAIQSGCALVKTFPPGSERALQTPQRQTPPSLTTGTRAKGVASDAPAPSHLSKHTAADKNVSEDEIQLVQVRLKEAGFDPGPIDGIIGPKTKTAIDRYRLSRGLKSPATLTSGVAGLLEY